MSENFSNTLPNHTDIHDDDDAPEGRVIIPVIIRISMRPLKSEFVFILHTMSLTWGEVSEEHPAPAFTDCVSVLQKSLFTDKGEKNIRKARQSLRAHQTRCASQYYHKVHLLNKNGLHDRC